MAYIINGFMSMADFLHKSIQEMRNPSAAMLILRVAYCADSAEVLRLLRTQSVFRERADDDVLPAAAVGRCVLSSQKTAYDALRDLSGAGPYSVADTLAALECNTGIFIPGRTVSVDFMEQSLAIDVVAFSKAAGLPLEGEGSKQFVVFVHDLPAAEDQETNYFISILPGTVAPDCSDDNNAAEAIKSVIAGLQKWRLGTDHYRLEAIKTGWQLHAHPDFPALLGNLRYGHSYLITSENGSLWFPDARC